MVSVNLYSENSKELEKFLSSLDDFKIVMWVSLDKGIYINVTEENADNLIKYLYERYPY